MKVTAAGASGTTRFPRRSTIWGFRMMGLRAVLLCHLRQTLLQRPILLLHVASPPLGQAARIDDPHYRLPILNWIPWKSFGDAHLPDHLADGATIVCEDRHAVLNSGGEGTKGVR